MSESRADVSERSRPTTKKVDELISAPPTGALMHRLIPRFEVGVSRSRNDERYCAVTSEITMPYPRKHINLPVAPINSSC